MNRAAKRRHRRRQAHSARTDHTSPVVVVRDELRHMTTADLERAAQSALDTDPSVYGSTARRSILDAVRRRPKVRTTAEAQRAFESDRMDAVRRAFKGIAPRRER